MSHTLACYIGYPLQMEQRWSSVLGNAYSAIMPLKESNVNTWQYKTCFSPLRLANVHTAFMRSKPRPGPALASIVPCGQVFCFIVCLPG